MTLLENRLRSAENKIKSAHVCNTYFVEIALVGEDSFSFEGEKNIYPLQEFKIEAAKRWEKSGKRDINVSRVLEQLTHEQLHFVKYGIWPKDFLLLSGREGSNDPPAGDCRRFSPAIKKNDL